MSNSTSEQKVQSATINSIIALNGIVLSIKSHCEKIKTQNLEEVGRIGKYETFKFYGSKTENNVDVARKLQENAENINQLCIAISGRCIEIVNDNSKLTDERIKLIVADWERLVATTPFIEHVIENVLNEDNVLEQKIIKHKDNLRRIKLTNKTLFGANFKQISDQFNASINSTITKLNKRNPIRTLKHVSIDFEVYEYIYNELKSALATTEVVNNIDVTRLIGNIDNFVVGVYTTFSRSNVEPDRLKDYFKSLVRNELLRLFPRAAPSSSSTGAVPPVAGAAPASGTPASRSP